MASEGGDVSRVSALLFEMELESVNPGVVATDEVEEEEDREEADAKEFGGTLWFRYQASASSSLMSVLPLVPLLVVVASTAVPVQSCSMPCFAWSDCHWSTRGVLHRFHHLPLDLVLWLLRGPL